MYYSRRRQSTKAARGLQTGVRKGRLASLSLRHRLLRRRHALCLIKHMERHVNAIAYRIMVALGAYICLFTEQRRALLLGALMMVVAGALSLVERRWSDREPPLAGDIEV
jgi:hypothetical protein